MKVTIRKAFNIRKSIKNWMERNHIDYSTGICSATYTLNDLYLPDGTEVSDYSLEPCLNETTEYFDNLKLAKYGNLTYREFLDKTEKAIHDIAVISMIIDKSNDEQRELLIKENELKEYLRLYETMLRSRGEVRTPARYHQKPENKYVKGEYVEVMTDEIEISYDAYRDVEIVGNIDRIRKELALIRDRISYNDNVKEIEISDDFSDWI